MQLITLTVTMLCSELRVLLPRNSRRVVYTLRVPRLSTYHGKADIRISNYLHDCYFIDDNSRACRISNLATTQYDYFSSFRRRPESMYFEALVYSLRSPIDEADHIDQKQIAHCINIKIPTAGASSSRTEVAQKFASRPTLTESTAFTSSHRSHTKA